MKKFTEFYLEKQIEAYECRLLSKKVGEDKIFLT